MSASKLQIGKNCEYPVIHSFIIFKENGITLDTPFDLLRTLHMKYFNEFLANYQKYTLALLRLK